MTITELSAAWNDLRNAALGRGTKPNVSAALAARVGSEYDAWRAYFETAPPTEDADMPAVTLQGDWLNRYRVLVAAVQSEGVSVAALPKDASERALDSAKEGIATLGTALQVLAIAAAVTIPVALVLTLRGRR